ncbi:hypothetical protein RTP6_006360 [Batrachochytrium dendrobatidis]
MAVVYQIQDIFITLLDTMLITLECVLLALQAVAAVRLALKSPNGIAGQSSNRLSKRSPVELGGDFGQCFTIKSNVHGVDACIMPCIVMCVICSSRACIGSIQCVS